ncbi:MAG: OmpH family outer membrane protein [Rhodobacteraceae bacterium]|nr:OmpH family outer membrane protein [Paracoccaceae bacterium]
MSRLWAILLAGALFGAPVSVSAQAGPALPPPPQGVSAVPFRILDQDRLLRGSQLGQQILEGIRAAESRLAAENQRLFDQLAAEERALTDARATLSADEFRARADAFDARVESIRTERAQASQDLTQWSEREAQRFFDAALPVLVQMMNDEGLLALLKPDTLILGSDWLDITDAAIARIDAAVADGSAPAPTPEPPPDPAPPAGDPVPAPGTGQP